MLLWDIQFTPEAIGELQQAVDYYNTQKNGLGHDFLTEFDKQIEQIVLNPFTSAIRYLDVRFALIQRFPYAIHYVIRENTGIVIVQTVLSTFKDPKTNWKQR